MKNNFWALTNRRKFLTSLLAITGVTAVGTAYRWFFNSEKSSQIESADKNNMIKQKFSLDFQWPVQEPFLFCVHHYDLYPKGNGAYGPDKTLLQGRQLGQDFAVRDGFRMYHGQTVPGFPVHPHRGFETITIVRKGFVDHADSLGAAGRYGEGDVQWMTAGAGVQHSEMFPLLRNNEANTVELFQVWLNLPKRSKMVPAHFKMFWSEDIPQITNDKVKINLIAGEFAGQKSLVPPPDSWAADSTNEVLVMLVKIDHGGVLKIPRSKVETNRTLYFFDGQELKINESFVSKQTGLVLDSQCDLEITTVHSTAEFLILQAKVIGEPVVQHGPFVMNSKDDIIKTIEDYRRTEFGGWSWNRHDMVHGSKIERFAQYPDGRIEKPVRV